MILQESTASLFTIKDMLFVLVHSVHSRPTFYFFSIWQEH